MPTYCPFCAAPLAPTGDAFCGECRGQLDEAPPAGSTLADLEIRRKISSGSGQLTWGDLFVCILFPLIGMILGGVRAFQGNPAGVKLIALSGAMMVVQFILRLVIILAMGG